MPSRSCSSSVGVERRSEQPVLEPVAAALRELDRCFGAGEGTRPASGACSGVTGGCHRCASDAPSQPLRRAASERSRRRQSPDRRAGSARYASSASSPRSPEQWSDRAVHVVVVGCGRVGSELAGMLEKQGHTVAVIDKRQDAFRRLPTGFGGLPDRRLRLRPRHARRRPASSEAGALAAVTSGDNSNIMSARVARETFEVERVVARIYDPRRAAIYQRLGIPTVATVSWTTDQVMRRLLPGEHPADWIDAERQGLASSSATSRRRGPASGSSELDEPGRFTVAAVTRLGAARVARPRPRRPGGRHPPLHGRRRRRSTRSQARLTRRRRRGAPLMRVAVAGAGNVGGFIAERARRERPRGAAHRAAARTVAGASCRPSTGIEVRVGDACEVVDRSRRPGSNAATSSSPRPVTTRTTSSSRCSRSRSSRCHASSPA